MGGQTTKPMVSFFSVFITKTMKVKLTNIEF